MRSSAIIRELTAWTSTLQLSQIQNSYGKGAAIHDFKHPDRIIIGTRRRTREDCLD